jgi:regulator of sigma E protease
LTEEEKLRSFAHKPPLQRIAIVLAGPTFNLIFAWLAFIVLCMLGVPTVTAKIGEVLAEKPAAKAGIQKNDIVTSINGKPVTRWDELASMIAESKGQPLKLSVKRGDQNLPFSITPEPRTSKNLFGEKVDSYAIGVASAGDIVTEYFGPIEAIGKGTTQTITVIELTFMSLVKLAQRVVPLDSVGGPIMIVKMAGQQAAEGSVSFLAFVALLSINLGILNLLPVPILDGGHLFFYFWEAIFRKPVSPRAREIAQQVGLVLLISLMVLAFYNDIARYFLAQKQ